MNRLIGRGSNRLAVCRGRWPSMGPKRWARVVESPRSAFRFRKIRRRWPTSDWSNGLVGPLCI